MLLSRGTQCAKITICCKDLQLQTIAGVCSGTDRGPVVAEKDAEAAVAAAKEAACQQQEQALQHCNAEWTNRLGQLSFSIKH